ncbi:MAG TPA: hypothetical protein VHH73_04380, partial [Verrucomicrobiae bacterium]|nr:hypothetical protein [Verrucomicrobiae bacterium]
MSIWLWGQILAFSAPKSDYQQKFATYFSETDPAVPIPVRQSPHPTAWDGAEKGPVADLKVFARQKNGVVWLGSDEGAARFDAKASHPWDRWHYFHGKSWLADNEVKNIVVEDSSPETKVWIRTATGVSLIEWRPFTLEEKARAFEERIEQRHVRHGFVADSWLQKSGDLASNHTIDNDNDGLWTAMYLAAEVYRYAVTKDPDARAKAGRSLHALMRLEEITGIPGFPARSFVSGDRPKPQYGEWHATTDGKWWWKGDTSSDE